MWLDQTSDGACHVGIDAFLSRALGHIDRIAYVWQSGCHRPTAVLTAGGIDFEVVFPNHLQLTGCNLYLRADPARLATQPYTGGWLFEGTPVDDTGQDLIEPAQARMWMEQEQRRMNEYLQPGPYRADGGLFVEGLPGWLDAERMRALFHEFFSPLAKRKR
jgi:glycine cleavage system H lipoate-binding protein